MFEHVCQPEGIRNFVIEYQKSVQKVLLFEHVFIVEYQPNEGCSRLRFAARPTKPPPPPRSLPPVAKPPLPKSPHPSSAALDRDRPDNDDVDAPKTCDDSCSASDEACEPVNFSAPECDHSSPEMARLTSLQYCGSETESEIYPTIQFGDDVSALVMCFSSLQVDTRVFFFSTVCRKKK